MPDLCVEEGLEIYIPSTENPWNKQRVQHLYRRLGFSANRAEIDAALIQDPSTLIDAIIDAAVASPLPDAPFWADYTVLDYLVDGELDATAYFEHAIGWFLISLNGLVANPIRDRVAFFWSSFLVTSFNSYTRTQPLYKYHKLLLENGLGNFKDLITEIGKTPAMLIYLNGAESSNENPNENYARELYELFTLGENNGYTQEDIEETARALTGWTVELEANALFNPALHDGGSKTIFGQTGNWAYQDVHDLLFEQRSNEIATHICTAIYKFYVSDQVDEEIVSGLASTFIENNFEIAPVFKQLFKSAHFFALGNIGIKIKSPLELEIGIIRETEIPMNFEVLEFIFNSADLLGQTLFSPPDVSGWPGHHTWINTADLVTRWEHLDAVVFSLFTEGAETMRNWTKDLVDNSNDAEFVTRSVVDHFLSRGLLNDADYDEAIGVFKAEVPENYFEDGSWNLDWESAPYQIAVLFRYIFQLPEFHLN